MKLVKSMLLASAAGLAAVSGAQAADLGGAKKPAPAEYVRVCNAYGAGFFFIPGTQTCLRVSGRAAAFYNYTEWKSRQGDATGFRVNGRIGLDARTQSEYGPIRTFVQLQIASRSGTMRSGSAERLGTAIAGTIAGDTAGRLQTQVMLSNAFVQFGGLTAGRLGSFFDFGVGGDYLANTINGGTWGPTHLLAYTATFGSGFSATLSVEDNILRRNRISNLGTVPAAQVQNYTGQLLPDVVGALRVDQGWGSAQLSGALHQIVYAGPATTAALPTSNAIHPDADFGFAVLGGVRINLPMLGSGDSIGLQGIYTKGALAYVIGLGCGQESTGQCATGKSWGGNAMVDSIVGPGAVAGSFVTKLTQAYAITGDLTHNWTPTVKSQINASYMRVTYSALTGVPNFTNYGVETNTTWTPVSGLSVTGSVGYNRINTSLRAGMVVPGGFKKNDDTWAFQLRVQRDF